MDKIKSRNAITTIVILLLALVLFGWFYSRQQKRAPYRPESSTPPPAGRVNLEAGSFVSPAEDFPWESGARYLGPGAAQVTDNTIEFSRAYTSSKTVAANYKIFSDYFTKNKWEIKDQTQTQSAASLEAYSPDKNTTVLMRFQTTSDNSTTVEIKHFMPYINLPPAQPL